MIHRVGKKWPLYLLGWTFTIFMLSCGGNGDSGSFIPSDTLNPNTTPPVNLPPNSFVVPPSGFLTAIPGTQHEVMILGLKPDQTYTVNVLGATSLSSGLFLEPPEITSTDVVLAKKLTFSTDFPTTPQIVVTKGGTPNADTVAVIETEPLPQDFPPINVLISRPSRMSPGFTIFRASGNASFGPYIIIVDALGEVVWYRPGIFSTATRMANGNLLMCPNSGLVEEVDMLGNVLRSLSDQDFGQPYFHHECLELENGNILTLSLEMRNLGPYPPNDAYYNVVGDVIFEFNWNGQVINQISVLDVLDPFRVVSGFDLTFWNAIFGLPTKDWTHGNAVIRDPRDNSYIVSFRHQDVVAKISYEGVLIWAIGEDQPGTTGDDNWPFLQLIGPGAYPNHQHAVEITPQGDLILYDNANATGLSRPVIYRIDEENLTMTQEWEYLDEFRAAAPVCAPFVGDANYLQNGNILINHAGMTIPGQACANGSRQILMVEVDRITKEKVFELEVKDPSGSLNGYRAVRLPTLYP